MDNHNQLNPENLVFVSVVPVNEFPGGERLFIEIDGEFLIIFSIAGEFYAIADLCSHDNGPLGDGELEDHQIICPRHGAHFDIRTGNALTLPAVEGIPSYPVRVRDGFLEVGIQRE